MTAEAITYQPEGGVAVITLNRPERMNRMDNAMMDGLHLAWKRLMASNEDRVAILTGAGDKAFCAGADLQNPPRHLIMASRASASPSTSRSSPRPPAG